MMLKAIVLQKQSVSHLQNANRKTPQNKTEKKIEIKTEKFTPTAG